MPFPGGQAGELKVRMLKRRDVGHRDRQRLGALDEATPGTPQAEHPGGRVTEHLELEGSILELVRQPERCPHVEARRAPAAP